MIYWAPVLLWVKTRLMLTPFQLRQIGFELAVVVLGLLLALILRRATVKTTDAWVDRLDNRLRNPRIMPALRRLVVPALWCIALLLGESAMAGLGYGVALLHVVANLLAAWVIVSATSLLVRDPLASRSIAMLVWIVIALSLVDLLEPTETMLDNVALEVGGLRLSLLGLIKAAVLLIILLWAAFALSTLVQTRLTRVHGLSPSIRMLINNLLRILLIFLAVIVALNSIGINLTALAVFSGAVGVGVGFGLQKVVSNLVSGIILLLDRSIKPGDVIEIEETFGWITSLGARYVSVRSRDGKEYLIPNEDLITHRVINWSYSSPLVRLDVPFGVAYGCDLRMVREFAIETALATERVLHQPAPVCHVTGFADSSVTLVLRIWIDDPTNGVTNVKGDVLLGLYEACYAHGVELPFPQRDIRIKEDVRVPAPPPSAPPSAAPPPA